MKKLLLILLCVPMVFSSCEEEATTPNTNNNGNNNDTFLSINDGTVWVRDNPDGLVSLFYAVDSLIGFYNADNFICQLYSKNNDFLECHWWSEGNINLNSEWDPFSLQVEIITNTTNEFEVTYDLLENNFGPYARRKITMMGENQLIEEGFFIDSLGQEIAGPTYTYIKSTTLQNLSCN
jgi:hypothetical protein